MKFEVKPTVNDLYIRLGLVAKVTDTETGKDVAFCPDYPEAERVAAALNG